MILGYRMTEHLKLANTEIFFYESGKVLPELI